MPSQTIGRWVWLIQKGKKIKKGPKFHKKWRRSQSSNQLTVDTALHSWYLLLHFQHACSSLQDSFQLTKAFSFSLLAFFMILKDFSAKVKWTSFCKQPLWAVVVSRPRYDVTQKWRNQLMWVLGGEEERNGKKGGVEAINGEEGGGCIFYSLLGVSSSSQIQAARYVYLTGGLFFENSPYKGVQFIPTQG